MDAGEVGEREQEQEQEETGEVKMFGILRRCVAISNLAFPS